MSAQNLLSSLPRIRLADGFTGRQQIGSGERVLWLHGYSLDSSSWGELWSLLPDWHHIGLDLPGHGGSALIDPNSDLIKLADRIILLCRELEIRHLVALSFGTVTALQLLIQEPRFFTTATFGAPAIAGGPTEPSMAPVYQKMFMLYRMTGRTQALVDLWMGSRAWRGLDKRPGLRAALSFLVSQHPWDELSDPRKASQMKEPAQNMKALPAIETRLSVLIGEFEMPAYKLCAELLTQGVPKCKIEELPETDHLCMLQSPELCARLIDEQLRSVRWPDVK